MLKALRESYDRLIIGGLIAAVAVGIVLPDGRPPGPGLGRLWVLAVVPLTAALIAWGIRLPAALLFIYGAVVGALALIALSFEVGLTIELEGRGLEMLGFRSLFCLSTRGLGAFPSLSASCCPIAGRRRTPSIYSRPEWKNPATPPNTVASAVRLGAYSLKREATFTNCYA